MWKVRYLLTAMLVIIRGLDMRLIRFIKYILFPMYRRSLQLMRYLDNGYSHKEALAKVKVIEF